MITKVFSATIEGIDAHLIKVEVDIALGLLQWNIVGLPDLAIKESKERITAAIRNSGIKLPERRITINLSPADTKKRGSLFDFAIIMGILDAAKIIIIPDEIKKNAIFIGEIGLDGDLIDARGALSIASSLDILKKKYLFLPKSRVSEASLIKDIIIFAPESIKECVTWFSQESIKDFAYVREEKRNITSLERQNDTLLDEIIGNEEGKRALQISLAGKHGLLLIGSPGSGKTLLAEKARELLPKLSLFEQIEVTKIFSAAGYSTENLTNLKPPFISPHHTISTGGLVGGGSIPRPGSISLAHKGILFLDELLEFKKSALESLRQPLESKKIVITRSQVEYTFPADFVLLAAANPCPCGYYGDKRRHCSCSEMAIKKYIQKLSGPLSERIDLHVGVYGNATIKKEIDPSFRHTKLVEGIELALAFQEKRFGNKERRNGEMNTKEIDQYCLLNRKATLFIESVYEKYSLSMRSFMKIKKIARTIADIKGKEEIVVQDIEEALSYRPLDRIV